MAGPSETQVDGSTVDASQHHAPSHMGPALSLWQMHKEPSAQNRRQERNTKLRAKFAHNPQTARRDPLDKRSARAAGRRLATVVAGAKP